MRTPFERVVVEGTQKRQQEPSLATYLEIKLFDPRAVKK